MAKAATDLCRQVGYVGAGTVEFIFDQGEFFFLEMNTRLQVEHPVTEEITGIDLVRWQIKVARGEPLDDEVLDPARVGHAIEVRLYAEDPENEFLPVSGTIERFQFPQLPGLRVESGVEDGSTISPFYDPMIAKVIAWGESREEAAAILARGLQTAAIHGPVNNRDLLLSILRHPEFLAGQTDTGFLTRNPPEELGRPATTADELKLALVAAALGAIVGPPGPEPASSPVAERFSQQPFPAQHHLLWPPGRSPSGRLRLRSTAGRGRWSTHRGDPSSPGVGPGRATKAVAGCTGLPLASVRARFMSTGPVVTSSFQPVPRFPEASRDDEAGSLNAPMPGKVIKVTVNEGDTVEEGQALVVLEAMKMEHMLRAPHPGIGSVGASGAW